MEMETFDVVDCATGEIAQITCSSEAAARSQIDNNFLIDLLKEARATTGNGMEENQSEFDLFNDEEPIAQGKKWNDSATLLLISLIKQTKGKVGNTFKFKTKKKLSEFIAEEMRKKGYSFSAIQVDNKYKGLEKSFRNIVNHNNKTGNNRLTCPFYNELYEVFKDRASMFPDFVLGASGKGSHCKQYSVQASTSRAALASTSSTSFDECVEDEENGNENNNYSEVASQFQPIRTTRRKPTKEEVEERRWQEKLEIMRDRNRILERELTRKNNILQDIAESLKQSSSSK